ncbi:MAG: hypothetical protein KF910_01525 [Brevundimonas sp.]|uniref:ImuA family protein n=1 Tax=Brevundimonas sp. TaxID=1871086 RepID=UPI0025B8FFD7|nr:hypothetical protein [Brevundimonas sp.]MBX3476263.1 hypothetical protein [Brevundimonas sp.]
MAPSRPISDLAAHRSRALTPLRPYAKGPPAVGVQPALHEIYAATALHAAAADGFALGMALAMGGAPLVWIREDRGRHETGDLHGAGLHEWGLAVDDLLLVRAPDARALLAAGEEVLRSGAARAVVMSGWGEARAFTLTASRRLALAAEKGGAAALLVRAGARPQPSAAATRWSVQAAPSRALAARAPGPPAFRATLLRGRAGLAPGEWIMEWDRDARAFTEAKTSGDLVSLPVDRSTGVRAA